MIKHDLGLFFILTITYIPINVKKSDLISFSPCCFLTYINAQRANSLIHMRAYLFLSRFTSMGNLHRQLTGLYIKRSLFYRQENGCTAILTRTKTKYILYYTIGIIHDGKVFLALDRHLTRSEPKGKSLVLQDALISSDKKLWYNKILNELCRCIKLDSYLLVSTYY